MTWINMLLDQHVIEYNLKTITIFITLSLVGHMRIDSNPKWVQTSKSYSYSLLFIRQLVLRVTRK